MSQVSLSPDRFSPSLGASAEALLGSLWRQAAPAPQEQEVVLNLIDEGQQRLNRWQASGFQNLEKLF
jgi:hypothetical protein